LKVAVSHYEFPYQGGSSMQALIVAEQDLDTRKQITDLLIEAGYNVIVTNSAANAVDGILKKAAQVVILGSEFDDLSAADMVPLLKQCNRNVTIILVSAEASLPVIRKLRRLGIFYHALKPVNHEDREELCEAVRCAFAHHEQVQTAALNHHHATLSAKKEEPPMKSLLISQIVTAALLTLPTAALAASTTMTYNSGILVLAFVAFCALIVAVQLIPAIMMLAGALKAFLNDRREAKYAEEKA
jgi:FixJ family two-component response regulator